VGINDTVDVKKVDTKYTSPFQSTQGQALESKYWFPCLDDPQVKFPREIQVSVPDNDFIVISNGVLANKEGDTWFWKEPNPTPAYLTSVVIGRFVQETQEYHSSNGMSDQHNIISLSHYWPKDIPKENAMLTFAYTPDMMRFFEEFFGVKYPYKKYAQVAVEQFEFAGMENTNCTNTDTENNFYKRLAATSALSKFLSLGMKDDDNGNSLELIEINQKVFSCLCGLLKDKRRKIKINACKALTDKDAKPPRINCKWLEVIELLIQVAETDLDGFVRREAEWCANILRIG
jgi:Peptidase M1 N-terminal domain/Peptidase family M1 domain